MRARSRRPAPERAPPLEVRAPPSHRWGSPERGSTPSGRRQTLCQGPKERAQRPRGNMTAITKITNAVKGRVPSAPVLIGGVYCLCVLAIIRSLPAPCSSRTRIPFGATVRSRRSSLPVSPAPPRWSSACLPDWHWSGRQAGLGSGRSCSARLRSHSPILLVGRSRASSGLWPFGSPGSLAAVAHSTVPRAFSGLSACASRSSTRPWFWVESCSTS
jgi:hypothetical protein